MARTARFGLLETRTARLKLKPRKKPYFARTGKAGVHLGYRRRKPKTGNANGSWVVRRYVGEGQYETEVFGEADDYSEADGQAILTYHQAVERLGGELSEVQARSRYTVEQACSDYVAWLAQHRKSSAVTQSNLRAYVLPYFGDRLVSELQPQDFDRWLTWALAHKPKGRLKTGKHRLKGKRPDISASERERRKKSTLNRVINALKGALNRAYDTGRVKSKDGWARLKKFRGADSARIHRLTTAQAVRLINACPLDFRQLVRAALLTGCRYGELGRLKVSDFDARSATILIAESKSGKARRVPLTADGVRLFSALSAGKLESELLLTKADGSEWAKSEQSRRMKAACEAAKISPSVNFHALRHTYASLLVENGTPLAFVAEALGHADTRMVSKHYAHLAPNHIADSIRANLPSFGEPASRKVASLAERRS